MQVNHFIKDNKNNFEFAFTLHFVPEQHLQPIQSQNDFNDGVEALTRKSQTPMRL